MDKFTVTFKIAAESYEAAVLIAQEMELPKEYVIDSLEVNP